MAVRVVAPRIVHDTTSPNSGKVKVRGGWMQLAPNGTSDILGLVRGGRFVALEVKLPGEKPTAEQLAFGARVVELGGFFAVVTSVDEAVAAVRAAIARAA
jgi:hypothetical protein